MKSFNILKFSNEEISRLMNFFKKGGEIHIKKKNVGKFKDYCGGEVTEACIQKAKKSGNKKLIKRATFAQNSRKWNKK